MEKVNIDGVDLYLSHPDELNLNWIGDSDELKQLLAAWMILDKDDIPLNPRILGKPGVGKTTLAYAAAKKISKEVYIFQCTMDTRPEDLIIQPIIGPNNTIEYHASPLLTAAIKGGVCILDEGNRMSEKAWASLAPLLDKRRYVESIIAGIKIKAHKDFRIAVTMNVDSSTFEIPEYIDSRLQPKIILDFPHAK
ncbi:MAG: AAA family ATPase, partial [Promethearchaeota archaeon]